MSEKMPVAISEFSFFGDFCYFAKKQIPLKLTVALGGESPECSQVMNDDITVFVLFVTVV